jgi:hypothetical protein
MKAKKICHKNSGKFLFCVNNNMKVTWRDSPFKAKCETWIKVLHHFEIDDWQEFYWYRQWHQGNGQQFGLSSRHSVSAYEELKGLKGEIGFCTFQTLLTLLKMSPMSTTEDEWSFSGMNFSPQHTMLRTDSQFYGSWNSYEFLSVIKCWGTCGCGVAEYMLNTTFVGKRRKKMLNTLYFGACCMLSRSAFQFLQWQYIWWEFSTHSPRVTWGTKFNAGYIKQYSSF